MAKNELVINRGLKFGIELEVITSNMRLTLKDVRALIKTVVKCNLNERSYTHEVTNAWKVVTDGSLNGGNGFEIVSPPLTNFDEVEKVCKVLNDNGFTVNKSCGFHVHHEILDLDYKAIRNLYQIYNKYEEAVITKLLPKSRSEVLWCTALNKSERRVNGGRTIMERLAECENLEDVVRKVGECHINRSNVRYHSLNLNSFIKYGTIEFRHHSGTIDFNKIRMWVLLTHKMIETATTKKKIYEVSASRKAKWDEEVRHSSFDFYKELGINGTELSEYLGNRRKELKQAHA